MKKAVGGLLVLFFSMNLMALHPNAVADLDKDDLTNVTISLLHPTVVQALKDHYGGFTQFEDLSLEKIISRDLPADLKEDSAFKSSATIFEITLQLTAILNDGKKEKVTIVLSNEFSSNGYDVVTIVEN